MTWCAFLESLGAVWTDLWMHVLHPLSWHFIARSCLQHRPYDSDTPTTSLHNLIHIPRGEDETNLQTSLSDSLPPTTTMGLSSPLPVSLPAECRRAAKLYSAFADRTSPFPSSLIR